MSFRAAKYVFGLLIAIQCGSQCFAQNSIFAQFDALACQGAGDRNFPNSSAISSVSIGGTNSTILSPSGGVGRVTFADIKLVKPLDDCTPLLFNELATGRRLNTVTIRIQSPATKTAPAGLLLLIQLSDAIISSDQFAEAVGGRPSEILTVVFSKIRITHVPSGNVFAWDVIRNSSF